jgi:hypothetical protein
MKGLEILKKYGIVLIIFFFIKPLAAKTLMPLYVEYIEMDEVTRLEAGLHQTILYAVSWLCNVILVFFLLRDLKNGFPLKWVIIVLTLLYAEVGIVFFLIVYFYNSKTKTYS